MTLTIDEAYVQYCNYVELRLKGQTVRAIKGKFEKHILSYFMGVNIYDIKAIDYLQFQSYIEKNGLSFNTKKNIHFIFSSFLNFCVNFYDLEYNVAQKVGNFKRKNEKIEKYNFYTLSEFNKFIKFVDEEVYKQFFIFMFYTGTRPGEAMALKFSDINGNYISINKTIDEHGKREVNSPKTISSYRDIIIDNFLLNNLNNLKKYYSNKYNNSDYDYFIFGGIKPLAPTTINRRKEKACQLSGIKKIKLHDFRHSHATLLINLGIPINEISRRLGHGNISTTLNIYVHKDLENEKRVFETLSSIHND